MTEPLGRRGVHPQMASRWAYPSTVFRRTVEHVNLAVAELNARLIGLPSNSTNPVR